MSALDYILSNYQQEKYKDSLAERAVLSALVHTLNEGELHTLQKELKRGSSKWSVGRTLYNEATKVLGKIHPQRSESITTLLKAFSDKRSGKVAEARLKLRDRFSKQSFQTQRKILKAMLSASKQDRLWAYIRLNCSWDNFFFEDVKFLWEQYHEKECGAVVSKHFPMQYVYDNLFLLDTHDNYTSLCIKLIHHPLFKIDKERLKENPLFYGISKVGYLYVLAKSKSTVEKGFATNVLFTQMVTFINIQGTLPKYQGSRGYDFEWQVEAKTISTKFFYFVPVILWCMGELGLTEELIAFEEWDDKVKNLFLGSEELTYLEYDCSTNNENELWNLFRQTIVECLPSGYQQLVQVKISKPTKPTKEELMGKNPAMGVLVNSLGLKEV